MEISLDKSIFQLFPYSSGKYDPVNCLEDIKESLKNLNTRLSNLKKINKSLNEFDENLSSMSWDELKDISQEIHEYEDYN